MLALILIWRALIHSPMIAVQSPSRTLHLSMQEDKVHNRIVLHHIYDRHSVSQHFPPHSHAASHGEIVRQLWNRIEVSSHSRYYNERCGCHGHESVRYYILSINF